MSMGLRKSRKSGRLDRLFRRAIVWSIWMALIYTLYFETTRDASLATIGSYNLSFIEVAMVPAFIALIIGVVHRARPGSSLGVLILSLAAILAFNVFRGMLESPVAAFKSLRNTGEVFVLMLLVLYFPVDKGLFQKITNAIMMAATYVCILEVFRYIYGASLFLSSVVLSSYKIDQRGASNDGAVLVAAAAVLQMSCLIRRPSVGFKAAWRYVHLTVLIGGLLVSLQATAIIAGMLALFVVYVFERGKAKSAHLVRISLAIFLVVPPLVVLAIAPDIVPLPDWVSGYLMNRYTTATFREHLWAALISDYGQWSVPDQFFGLPAGILPQLVVPDWGGEIWQFSVHSMYFGLVINCGVIGLLLYFAILVHSTFQNARFSLRGVNTGLLPSPVAALALTVLMVVYGYSYEIRNGTGIFLFLALAAARYSAKAQTVKGLVPNSIPEPFRQSGAFLPLREEQGR